MIRETFNGPLKPYYRCTVYVNTVIMVFVQLYTKKKKINRDLKAPYLKFWCRLFLRSMFSISSPVDLSSYNFNIINIAIIVHEIYKLFKLVLSEKGFNFILPYSIQPVFLSLFIWKNILMIPNLHKLILSYKFHLVFIEVN